MPRGAAPFLPATIASTITLPTASTIAIAKLTGRARVVKGFLSSARVLVDSAPDLEVVGEASDDTEAVALARKERPDVILMDIRMPHLDGLEATRVICGAEETGDVKVLILTTFDLDEYVYAALRAGARRFLLKDTRPTTCWPGSGSWRRATHCSRRA